MGWVRLDDQFARHPKVLTAGPLAGWLHICGLTYSAQYLTDGFIPSAAVNALADFSEVYANFTGSPVDISGMDVVGDLVKAKLWAEVEGGYQIHDYLDYNPSRDDVQKKRQADLERKRNAEGTLADSARIPNGVAKDSTPPVPRPRPVPEPNSRKPVEETPNGVLSAHADDPDVEHDLFEYYRLKIQPKARQFPRKRIAARLKRFTPGEIRDGIDHFASRPWWMEHNGGRGADWFFESDARAEQFLLMGPEPPPNVVPIREEVCSCEEGKADLAISRNCWPQCAVHGDVRKLLGIGA